MPRDIKFTAFGIPYILEFENVSFARRPNVSPSSSSSSFCYIETPPSSPSPPLFSLRSASSLFKRRPRPPPPSTAPRPTTPEHTKPLPVPPSPPPEADGIYIQFPPEHPHSQLRHTKRLVCLQKVINMAVLDAGMSRSSGNTARPENSSADPAARQPRGQKTADALFSGTYGQLMAALEAAGLSVTPCADSSLSGHARLGTLFVARSDSTNGGVRLRDITLWG